MKAKDADFALFKHKHIEGCERAVETHAPISSVVRDLRAAVESETFENQKALTVALANSELKVFRHHAAKAIDRTLPATNGGTSASTLWINRSLLNFVSLVTPNIRLRARAGSGKSTALIVKCDFLIRELGVPPEAIQMLVFNRSASEDLKAKLRACLGADLAQKVGINTFHSLAYHVLKCFPETKNLTLGFNEEDRSNEEMLLSLKSIVRENTSKREYDHYRERYKETTHRYILNNDFESSIQDFVTKAAALYRSRRGTHQSISTNPITRHLQTVVDAYEARMLKTKTLDGEEGIRKAARILASDADLPGFSRLTGALQFLFVDEFQDFSAAFFEITKGVMSRNPVCTINAVGDDWQAINSFMGADLSFFRKMDKAYEATLKLPLSVNWRCGKHIVDLGNKIMDADAQTAAVPAVAHEGRIRVRVGGIQNFRRKRDDWQPEALEFLDRQIPYMAQLAWGDDARAGRPLGSIVLLATLNKPFGKSLSNFVKLVDVSAGGEISWSTTHSSKGGEWDHVILLDGTKSHYPLEHPAEPTVRDMIKREDLEEEGRRLLYVAVTRAKQSLSILAPTELHPRLQFAQKLAQL